MPQIFFALPRHAATLSPIFDAEIAPATPRFVCFRYDDILLFRMRYAIDTRYAAATLTP